MDGIGQRHARVLLSYCSNFEMLEALDEEDAAPCIVSISAEAHELQSLEQGGAEQDNGDDDDTLAAWSIGS
jgi:hypothetical protein